MNDLTPSLIVAAMKKTLLVLAVLAVIAMPAAVEASEAGVIFGGSKRVAGDDQPAPGTELLGDSFSFSNSTIDVFFGFELDSSTNFKLRAGRIEGPVGFREETVAGPQITEVRRDVEGEIQHVSGLVEYRFSEAFGSTGLFGGVGLYRQEAPGFSSATDYGFVVGVNADFPLSRRYGVILDATYHMTKLDFAPRYLTVGAGFRIAFD